MRVLLDSNLPRAFATLLPGHRTDTTHQRRWSDLPVLAALAQMVPGELRIVGA